MMLWNALWHPPMGRRVSLLNPSIRVFIRVILKGNTDGAFPDYIIYKNEDGMDILLEFSELRQDSDDWVIRRKPSNPDRKQKQTYLQMLFGL